MKRDQRDPGMCGLAYLEARKVKVPIELAVKIQTPDYKDGGHISSNPEEHHSKTPQVLGDLTT